MNRLSIARTRKGKVTLTLSAAAFTGMAIAGGAAAANAASTPATHTDGAPVLTPVNGAPVLTPVNGDPVLTPVKGAPDMSKVKIVNKDYVHSVPQQPVIVDGGNGVTVDPGDISVTEVPGAHPDFSKVEKGDDKAKPIDAPIVVIGEGGVTAVKR